MLKVAILDDYQNVAQQFVDLEKLSGKYEFKIFDKPFTNEDDAIDQLMDFEALLIMRERTAITQNLINKLNKLKYIITSGLRNKSINLEAAKKRNIIVCGTESNLNPTPELTWALILGLARNFKEEIDNMYQGYWQTTVGIELKGKILGLIGLGRVGSQVAKIGKAFGMKVTGIRRNPCNDEYADEVLGVNQFEALLPLLDYLVLALPDSSETRNIINNEVLEKLNNSAMLLNVGRGSAINEQDLSDALNNEEIASAALDTTKKEPLEQSSPLWLSLIHI